MATHYIQMDRGETAGEATTGTAAPTYSSGYDKEGTVTWDTTTVTTKALLIDSFRKIKENIAQSILRNGGGTDTRKGYYVGIDDTVGEVGYASGSLTTGSGKDVTFEGQFISDTYDKNVILQLAEDLEDAISQMNFPLG
jgi:hypothetical protein